MTSEQPKISISYNPVSGEFTVKVTNTTHVSYTLEYDWENIDDEGQPYGGTDALINTSDADSKNIFQDTQLAGTESSGDKFVHQPVKGVVTLSADTPDGKVLSYQAGFKITESGSVKIISEETTSKAKSDLSVLGESSGSAEPTMATFSQPVLERRNTTVQPSSLETNSKTNSNLPLVPIIIGVSILLAITVIVGTWFYKKRTTTVHTIQKL